MDAIRNALTQSLKTGFIDKFIHSNKEYLPQLLVNDKGKKVLTTIDYELRRCDAFYLSVAFVTTSGVASLINAFELLRKRDVKGKILVSQYLNFTQPEALRRLLQFENIELKIVIEGNFHSKGYLFRNGQVYDLIIGSSNLTSSALCTNKEWNLKISATLESDIIHNTLKEFNLEFDRSIHVTEEFLKKYEELYFRNYEYTKLVQENMSEIQGKKFEPNEMQAEALENLKQLRLDGKSKALLISATGTGKTYLSAFDAQRFNPNKLLFVVHRANIAQAALKSFKNIFGQSKTMGMYSGKFKELDKDFIFSTIQTISKPDNLQKFAPNAFDYIIIDETHRAGAASYTRILEHFKPKFLLGMTATPERTDGLDIFKLFDHTIAYEIRLHRALEEEMLTPFHYYGVTDITVNGEVLKEEAGFSLLTSNERIDHIIEKAKFYGCDDGTIRGLIFCSNIKECIELSKSFNLKGYKTVALTGSNSEEDRTLAINRLESDNKDEKLDYIFTVDIFNEGIDIPKVNQIIMLRPTQSAIVFVQQLGRGLRKTDDKEYLTVIDFIGNYKNNYLVPIALYGDTSYNKDSIRKLMVSGSSLIPGSSTINFDEISRDRIFEAIDSTNMQLMKDLKKDYHLLKFKLGRIPMMMDFIQHGSRDPQLYVKSSAKSYFNFVQKEEKELQQKLTEKETRLLKLFSREINNTKRIEESVILKELINNNNISIDFLKKHILEVYKYNVSNATITSCINNLNFGFVKEKKDKKERPVREIYNLDIVRIDQSIISFEPEFQKLISQNSIFVKFLLDSTDYSIHTFTRLFDPKKFRKGFVLYRKYTRKDVFRILNWRENPLAQNVGGYMASSDKTNCPIFVNYHKEEDISNTTKYEDGFINNAEFKWMSKSNRNLKSNDVLTIRNQQDLRLPLFIKKSNDEGKEFYYMGDIKPIDDSFEQSSMKGNKNKDVSVVKVRFTMNDIVEEDLYQYITTNNS